jgi:hypothetical protein
MPGVSRLARRRWYVYHHANVASSSDPRTSFIVGYLLGWRECVIGSAAFVGLPDLLRRLNELLEDSQAWQAAADVVDDADLEADMEAELAHGFSALWGGA